MAHKHPIYANEDRNIGLGTKRDPWVDKLMQDVASDQYVMRHWLDRKVHFYNRSYNRAWPRPTVPWVGSSDVVVPLSDILITDSKPVIMAALFGGPQTIRMLPANNEAIAFAAEAEAAMETNIRFRMPRLKAETAYTIDSFYRFGMSVSKSGYEYVTQLVDETVRKNTLPDPLGRIIVVPQIDPQQQLQLAQQFGVEVVTKDQFDANVGRIEDTVVKVYDLDLTAKTDRTVLKQVMGLIRNGNDESEEILSRRAVLKDGPTYESIPIDSFSVPPGTRHLQDATRCTHEVLLPEEEIRERQESEEWDSKAVEALLEAGETTGTTAVPGLTNQLEIARRDRAGNIRAQMSRHKLYRVQEVHVKRLVKGKVRKAVVTMNRQAGVVMKAIWNPFHHNKFPFTVIDREYNEPGYGLSRGISEQIENQERHATSLARAELNNLLIETSRSFTLRKGSGLSAKNIRWAPGLIIPVMRNDDLTPLQMTPSSLALERPILQQMSLAERLAGIPSTTKARDQKLIEPITATQSRNEESERQRQASLQVMMFIEGWAQAQQMSWSNWKQFGPKTFFALTNGGELKSVAMSDIRGEYRLLPVAAIGDQDPGFRKAAALERYSLLIQAAPFLINDPQFVPNIALATKDAMDASDPMASARLLPRRPPQQGQDMVQFQAQQAERLQAVREEGEAIAAGAPFTEAQAATVLQAIQQIAPPSGMVALRDAADKATSDAASSAALLANAGS
jgi:hypothetical protein